MNVTNKCNTINLLSNSLSSLEYAMHDDVKEICSSYTKRIDSLFLIILTLLVKQRIYLLVLWV